MKKVIFVLIFGILLNSCDRKCRKCRNTEGPITHETLHHAVAGKPYYAEITKDGFNQFVSFNFEHNYTVLKQESNGLKWEYTDKYKNPKAPVTSSSISIYGTPTKAGNIIIYASSKEIRNDSIKPYMEISPEYKKYRIRVLEEEPSYE